jgi:hypothetical protein
MKPMIVYARSNTVRKKEYRLRTLIEQDSLSGKKQVRKVALFEEGMPFIHSFQEKYDYLQQFDMPFLVVGPTTVTERAIVFPYISAHSYHSTLFQAMVRQNAQRLKKGIKEFANILSSAATEKAVPTAAFQEWFGNSIQEPVECLPFGLIDLNFDNVLSSGPEGKYTLIDYEWVVESPVPYKFVLFRALYNFYRQYVGAYNLNTLFPLKEVYALLGISEQDIDRFIQMEYYFQSHVLENVGAIMPTVNTMIEDHARVLTLHPPKQKVVERTQAKIKELGDTLIQKNNYIDEVHLQIWEKDQHLQRLQEQLIEQKNSIQEKEQEVVNLYTKLDEAFGRIHDIDRQLIQQEEEMQRMQASKFWKLRALYLSLKSIKRFLPFR